MTATILLVLFNFHTSLKQQTLTRWYRSKLIICLLIYKTRESSPRPSPVPAFIPHLDLMSAAIPTNTHRKTLCDPDRADSHSVWPSWFVKMIPIYLFSELLTSGHNKIMVIVFLLLGSRLFIISTGCSLAR